MAIVIGGGNIFRGLQGVGKGFDRVNGDKMGMLATVINSLGLAMAIRSAGVEAEFSLQRNIVCQSSLKTLINRILRRINEIVDELELIAVPCIFDWEYLLEYLIETLVPSVLWCGVKLEEVLE